MPMEEPRMETAPRSPPLLLRRRKSPLQSDTYCTLSRILSYCSEHPQLCQPPQFKPPLRRPPRPINGGDVDLANCDGASRDVMDEIEIDNMLGIEDEDSLRKDEFIDGGSNGGGLEDGRLDHMQRGLIDELQYVMEGSVELGSDDKVDDVEISMGEKQGGGEGLVLLPNDREERFDLRNANESFGLFVDNSHTGEVSKLSNDREDRSTSQGNDNRLCVNHEDEDSLRKDEFIDGGSNVGGLEDGRLDQMRRGLIDELQHVMEGSVELGSDEKVDGVEVSMGEKQGGGEGLVVLPNDREERFDLQNAKESFGLFVDNSHTGEVSKLSNDREDKSTSQGTDNMLCMNHEGDDSLRKDEFIDGGSNGGGLEDGRLDQMQRGLIDELQHIMEGSVEFGSDEKVDGVEISMGEKQVGGEGLVVLLNDQDERFDLQNANESFGLFVDNSHTGEVSKLSNDREDRSTSQGTDNMLCVNHEVSQKGNELEKPAAVCSPIYVIQDGKMENREIYGRNHVDESSVDVLFEDTVLSQEKKVDDKQVSADITNKSEFPSNEKVEANKKGSGPTASKLDIIHNISHDTETEPIAVVRNRMVSKRKLVVYDDTLLVNETERYEKQKIVHGTDEENKGSGAKKEREGSLSKDGFGSSVAFPDNLARCAEKSKPNTTASQALTSKEKDAGIGKKKFKGPLSAQRKAKKKQMDRRKRAEKNRALGVKRLKLRPVVITKPVAICRHYLIGRCHEGEKCKFSHDAIPLTKSKPCCHFARHSCMKGDDCPFDHDLSKYPCTNFASKGYCSRGDNCMFSHKLLPKEDVPSASNICSPGLKTPVSLGAPNPKKQVDHSGASVKSDTAVPKSVGVNPCKSKEENFARCVVNPVVPPKGISFLSAGKLPVAGSSHSKLGSSSLKRNDVGNVRKQTGRGTSPTVQHLDEINGNPPAAPPKGINFLSFGKASYITSSTEKPARVGDDSVKFSISDNFIVDERARPSLKGDNGVLLGKEGRQNESNASSKLGEILKQTEFGVSPLKQNLFSFGEASPGGPRSDAQATLLSTLGSGPGRSFQASSLSSNKHGNSSTLPWGMFNGSGQSSNLLRQTCFKKSENSGQKAELTSKPWKTNPFSFGGASIDGARSNTQAGLQSSLDSGPDRFVQRSRTLSDEHVNSSSIPWGMSASSIGSSLSSNHLGQACLKNTPNSGQKALTSTLAFAAKMASEMKMNRPSVGSTSVSGGVNMETGAK